MGSRGTPVARPATPKFRPMILTATYTEADTCRKHVLPKLYAAGWTDDQISEQRVFHRWPHCNRWDQSQPAAAEARRLPAPVRYASPEYRTFRCVKQERTAGLSICVRKLPMSSRPLLLLFRFRARCPSVDTPGNLRRPWTLLSPSLDGKCHVETMECRLLFTRN